MQRIHKKINAFTVSELLVVLVISSIVIAITMIVLNLVQRQIKTISRNYDKQTEIRLLERILTRDFNTHQLIYHLPEQKMTFFSNADTVNYVFTKKYVVRNNDTLHLPVINITAFLDGSVSKTRTVDAVELQLLAEKKSRTIFVYKTKDAAFYMNNNGF